MSKIQRLPLKDQIKDIIINQINSGELKPGDKLRELAIAKEFGTSQAPVREAIRCLESLGYVQHKPNTGTTVKNFSLQEITESFQIREALEVYSLSSAFSLLQNRTAELNEINKNISRSFKDLIYFFELTEKFHRIIIEANNNILMLNMWNSLSIHFKIASGYINTKEKINKIYELNTEIFKSINKRESTESSINIIKFYDKLSEFVKNESK